MQVNTKPIQAPQAAIKIQTLGSFDVVIDNESVKRWRAGKARNLLQFLLLRPGRVVPRDVLYETLWPNLGVPRSSLKVAVHTLRNILNSTGADEGSSKLQIVTYECGYSLETENVWMDFQEFESMMRLAQDENATPTPAESLSLYRAAVELYRGDFLPGESMLWAESHREWLRSLALCAWQRLTAAAVRENDATGVLSLCRKILEAEPFHEETYRTLIYHHGRLGQLRQADRWYKLCVARFAAELQVTPSEATRWLYMRAIRGELLPRPGQGRGLQSALRPS